MTGRRGAYWGGKGAYWTGSEIQWYETSGKKISLSLSPSIFSSLPPRPRHTSGHRGSGIDESAGHLVGEALHNVTNLRILNIQYV